MRESKSNPGGGTPFAFLKKVDPRRISAMLREESPRISATVISKLDRSLAAKVLADFPTQFQREVVAAMRSSREAPPAIVQEIAETLREKLASTAPAQPASSKNTQASGGDDSTIQYGGPEVAAAILRYAPAETRRLIAENEPGLFAQLRKLMYTFDDLLKTTDRSLQILFADIEIKTIAHALKVAPVELKNRILSAVSHRRAAMIREELEGLQRVRMKDIEEAQQAVMDHAMELQRSGRILVDPDEAVT